MPKGKTKIAIFDIDGTIFRKNLQFELLDGLVYAGVFSKGTRSKLVEHFRLWLENRGTYETYRNRLIALYKKELKGKSKDHVVEVAKGVAAFHHARLFIYAKKIIETLRKTHLLVAISGSPIEVVKEFNSYLKFDDVFGTVYGINEDKVYSGEEVFSPVLDKASVVERYVAEKGISLKGSVGVGDTESDIPVLSLVDQPIAFNPNSNLYRHARREKWKVVVERKDVIYTIQ